MPTVSEMGQLWDIHMNNVKTDVPGGYERQRDGG